MQGGSRAGAFGAWLEVTVATSAEAVDAVSEMLMNLGAGGVVIDDPRLLARRAAEIGPDLVDEPDAAQAWHEYVKGALPEAPADDPVVLVRAYLPSETEFSAAVLTVRVRRLRDVGLDPGPATVGTRIVQEEDWAHAWKRYYTVQRIGQRLVIVPSWLQYTAEPGDVVITLDPGQAFGTGTHPTTRMCLEALEGQVKPGATVLDLGTGSGILAIAAALLGGRVEALDIDARAAAVAAENVAENGVSDIVRVEAGTLASVAAGARYDILIANIVADTIIHLLPQIPPHMKAAGVFIASGIVENRLDEVLVAWQQAGLRVREVRRSGEWACVTGDLQ